MPPPGGRGGGAGVGDALAAGLPPLVVALLQRALTRYLQPPLKVTFPFRITIVEIDPDTIAGRVVVSGVPHGYPWRVVPVVLPGGPYPVGYSEADTVAVPTITVLSFGTIRWARILS